MNYSKAVSMYTLSPQDYVQKMLRVLTPLSFCIITKTIIQKDKGHIQSKPRIPRDGYNFETSIKCTRSLHTRQLEWYLNITLLKGIPHDFLVCKGRGTHHYGFNSVTNKETNKQTNKKFIIWYPMVMYYSYGHYVDRYCVRLLIRVTCQTTWLERCLRNSVCIGFCSMCYY